MRQWRTISYRSSAFGALLNVPAIVVILVIVVGPILYSGWLSLHRYNLKRPQAFPFIGIGNYLDAAASSDFVPAVLVTFEFTVAVTVLATLVGLIVALLLDQNFRGRGLLRALIFVPWAIPPVVNGLMWQSIYDSKTGLLNALLLKVGLIDSYQGWLSGATSALMALVYADTWNAFPLSVILLLAALQRIPSELYEAARVDGASAFQMFWNITFPWLAQALMVVLIMQTMAAVRAFDIIYVLTGEIRAALTAMTASQKEALRIAVQ